MTQTVDAAPFPNPHARVPSVLGTVPLERRRD